LSTRVVTRRFLGLAVLLLLAAGCQDLPAAPDTNKPPSASFFFTPVSPIYAGITSVTFNASGSRDDDGRIASYVWDFGDGSAPQTGDGPLATHTFPDTAARCVVITYGVSVTVTDDKGATAVTSVPVTVTELPAPTALECTGWGSGSRGWSPPVCRWPRPAPRRTRPCQGRPDPTLRGARPGAPGVTGWVPRG